MPFLDSITHVSAAAERLQLRTNAFIDGAYRQAQSGERLETFNPATGRKLADIAACGGGDIDLAVAAARRSFEDGRWRTQPPAERKRILFRFADLIEAHREELALLETLAMGKPIKDAFNIDLPATVKTIRWYAEAIDKVYGETAPTADNVLATIVREPIGVVAAIVPWNFPLYMASWKFAPALAMGNSMILKPSELSSLSALRIAELACEAGIPDGVFNVVPGYGTVAGQALARHPDVDMLAFTGSTAIGKQLLMYAGESNMKRIALETGGKTPHIVMDDARDLDIAAHAAAWGAFFNQGEVCNAGSRLLVHKSIESAFIGKVVAITNAIRIGDPLDPITEMGPLVSRVQLDRVVAAIDGARTEGASLRVGGTRILKDSGGNFIEPTIFDNVRNDMRISQDEVFGPVLSVIPFNDMREAIQIANDTRYGLAAAIWTSDINTALGMAKSMRAGQVWINNFDGSDITVPWGGFKQSGIGRDKSLHALDKYSELKATWIQY